MDSDYGRWLFGDSAEFFKTWCCSHADRTPPDGSGRAICTACGTVVGDSTLTLKTLQRATDFAIYGVYYEDAWGNRIDPRDVHAGPADA